MAKDAVAKDKGNQNRARPGVRATPGRTRRGRANHVESSVGSAPKLTIVSSGLWALLLVAAVAAGPEFAELVIVPVAVVATASTLRAVEGRGRRRSAPRGSAKNQAENRARSRGQAYLGAELVLAVAVPLAALAGVIAGATALAVFIALAVVRAANQALTGSARPLRSTFVVAGAIVAPTAASTGLVMARDQGATLALALVSAVLVFDAGAFVMGHGRSALGGLVGAVFGAGSVVVVALFAAAVMDPPFSGIRSWVIFALTAVAAVMGVKVADWIAAEARLPALRRLDSLWLAAPVWVACASFALHR